MSWFSLLGYFLSYLLRTNFCLPDFIKGKGSRLVVHFCLCAWFLFYIVLCCCAGNLSLWLHCGVSPACVWSHLQSHYSFHPTNGAAMLVCSGAHRFCIDIDHCSYEQKVPWSRLFLLLTCELKELCVRRKTEWFLAGVNLGVSQFGYYWTELRGGQLVMIFFRHKSSWRHLVISSSGSGAVERLFMSFGETQVHTDLMCYNGIWTWSSLWFWTSKVS